MRQTFFGLIAIAISLPLAACGGCVMTMGTHDAEAPGQSGLAPQGSSQPMSSPRVQEFWQSRMNAFLKERETGSEVWALFSEGGWADAGQFMVFGKAEGPDAHLVVVEPSAKDISLERALTPAEWAKLKADLEKSKSIGNLENQAFDGLRFEFVHARKGASGDAEMIQRMFINNPGAGPRSLPHDALIDAFQTLQSRQK